MAQFPMGTRRLNTPTPLYLNETRQQAEFALLSPEGGHLLLPRSPIETPLRRLLVLIPDEEVNEVRLAQTIWLLAMPYDLDVLLIGVAWRGDAAYSRRRLVSLATQVRNGRVRVETTIYPRKSWLKAIAQNWRPGDVIVCHDQQRVSPNGWRRQLLGNWLLDVHASPVYILKGFYSGLPLEIFTLRGKALSVGVPLLIIVLFIFLQAGISQWPASWFYFPAMILSVSVEIGLIALWEGAFNR
jgi:hypothetical protein